MRSLTGYLLTAMAILLLGVVCGCLSGVKITFSKPTAEEIAAQNAVTAANNAVICGSVP